MINKYEGRDYFIAMFISRNKDNRDIDCFRPRNKTFLTQKTPYELSREFQNFGSDGLYGETSRFYMTANPRDISKVRNDLMHYLIDNPNVELINMDSIVAKLSMKPGTAKTKKFLFDFDDPSGEAAADFFGELLKYFNSDEIKMKNTPNGFVFITDRGFDTREILEAWPQCELKRDAMEFITSYPIKVVS